MPREMDVFSATAVESHSPFDIEKLSNQFRYRKSDWTIPEAFLCILLSAANVDGQIAVEEEAEIMALASRSRALKSLGPNDLARANQVVHERLKNRPDGLKEACQTLPADMCLPVFAHCVDLILADGELLKPEAEFLQTLTKMLDIEEPNARRVMEVLLLKNQY